MITTRNQLKGVLRREKRLYLPKSSALELFLTSDESCAIYRFVRALRYTEFFYNNRKNPINALLYGLSRRRKNILGRKLGIMMWENSFDSGLMIWHAGNIVVSGKARIGKNCHLHGSNCIGNNGFSTSSPKLGDNIHVGVGAKIIGDVELANNIIVAAGAVVVRSCLTEGAVLAGVPAKCIKIRPLNQ